VVDDWGYGFTDACSDFTSSHTPYTYEGAVTVTALSPTTGPARGEALVVVTGSGFVSGNTWCKVCTL
jgi:hypothetical protein